MSEQSGIAIIELVADIGGQDALSLLCNVYHFDKHHVAWRDAARQGLFHNRHNLNATALDELLRGT